MRTLNYTINRDGLDNGKTALLRITTKHVPEAAKAALKAMVDDVNRIPETDETNNLFEAQLIVGAGGRWRCLAAPYSLLSALSCSVLRQPRPAGTRLTDHELGRAVISTSSNTA